jgi:signal transduction histidine kinase
MFNRLRLRLTLLYFLFAIALVTLMGWGSYRLLDYYFLSSTDLALKYRMARELTSLRVDVPASLQKAQVDWLANRARLLPNVTSIPVISPVSESDNGQENDQNDGANEAGLAGEAAQQDLYDDSYEGDLAAIFVMPVGETGKIIFNPNPVNLPMSPDLPALRAALSNGSDLRTVTLSDGSKARVLTYHITQAGFPYLQLGRVVSDQANVLNEFLTGMIAFGGFSVIFLGIGAWWLAGRSIKPAQRAWESQRTFVANASHELRTPLTLMRASVEVAQRQTVNLQHRQLLADVLEECDSMNKLVEDLLILSRLDNQRLVMNLESVDLSFFIADLVEQIEKMAGRIEVNFQISSVSGVVVADPARLKQVLLILLDNSFRHTPAGGQVVLLAQPNGSYADIILTDTGTGISPEHLPNVFERFYKVDNSSGLDYRGSGLGLSIAKSLVEAQSGSIRLESVLGKGTRAIVSLPLAKKNL